MKLLDLFCGAGGAAMGYHLAGFTEIKGVDHMPMPHYPFDFIQADALDYLVEHGQEYDVIHASPPCQGYSRMRHLPWLKDRKYDLLIEPIRELLINTGKIWVIENVSDSPLNGAELCGMALGLPLIRHRRFESSQLLLFPPCPGHPVLVKGRKNMRIYGQKAGVMGTLDDPRKVFGIDWMTNRELRQAIPPAYTEYIGKQLLNNRGGQS